MELNAIEMDKPAARRAFLEYREAFREGAAARDGQLMRGYKALSEGKSIIRLSEVIKAGGVDAEGRPKLAVARADEARISFRREENGQVAFTPNITWRDGARSPDRVLVLPSATLSRGPFIGAGTWVAVMPIIPPHLRPPHALTNYHVLWEAAWTRPSVRRAPGDPALLRRIGGDAFVVIATWDLSPLEKAVLEGAF